MVRLANFNNLNVGVLRYLPLYVVCCYFRDLTFQLPCAQQSEMNGGAALCNGRLQYIIVDIALPVWVTIGHVLFYRTVINFVVCLMSRAAGDTMVNDMNCSLFLRTRFICVRENIIYQQINLGSLRTLAKFKHVWNAAEVL